MKEIYFCQVVATINITSTFLTDFFNFIRSIICFIISLKLCKIKIHCKKSLMRNILIYKTTVNLLLWSNCLRKYCLPLKKNKEINFLWDHIEPEIFIERKRWTLQQEIKNLIKLIFLSCRFWSYFLWDWFYFNKTYILKFYFPVKRSFINTENKIKYISGIWNHLIVINLIFIKNVYTGLYIYKI